MGEPQKSGLKQLIAACALFACCTVGLADQFGDFTYVEYSTYIEITDFRDSVTGDVIIPSQIVGKPVTRIGSQAFLLCSLSGVTIPDGVTSIGPSAFEGCTGLNSVTIPDGVIRIESYTFSGCTSLTRVTIPDSVTSIGDYAFLGCNGLTGVTIPDRVISIGKGAFLYCTSLISVTIPDSVTSIGYEAFSECTNLSAITVESANPAYSSHGGVLFDKDQTELIQYPGGGAGAYSIPDGVVTISNGAFLGCTSLTAVTIPNGVTRIPNWAFSGCTSLAGLLLPDSVTEIGLSAFFQCTSLAGVSIPDGVLSIGGSAFSGCTSLTSVTIPDGVTRIAGSTFSGCASLADVSIPDGVLSIGVSAFSGCTSLTSVTIPDGVTRIEEATFYGCASLAGVTIPDSVVSIAGSAFSGCMSLSSVTIPDGVTVIGISAFENCMSLTSAAIPGGVTRVENHLFEDCDSLTTITIGSGVLSIGEAAFANCLSLTDVAIPDSVTTIGKMAFSGCTSLTSVIIPDSVTDIGELAFQNCKSLSGVIIPDSVTSIRDYAFSGCTSLTQVIIPDSVTSIWGYAFSDCTSLTAITIPEGLTSLGHYAFKNCISLASIRIPGSLTTLTDDAFFQCFNLSSVTIGDGVTSIGWSPFYGCTNLSSITIPGTVTSIWPFAFNECHRLTSVYFEGNAPTPAGWTPEVFGGADQVIVYYRPGTTGWDETYGGRPTAPMDPVLKILQPPQSYTAAPGSSATFTVLTSNVAGQTFEWKHGDTVVGRNSPTLTLTNVQAADSGPYRLTVTSGDDFVSSRTVTLGIKDPPYDTEGMLNISTRGQILTGPSVMIAGFVLDGPGQKNVLIRGIGPTLGQWVGGACTDPRVELFRNTRPPTPSFAENDDWGTLTEDIPGITQRVGGFPLIDGSKDAVICMNLDPGAYTARISGLGGTGVGLVELYDTDLDPSASTSSLSNLSTRGEVGTQAQILIAGFVVGGDVPKQVLVRGIGPRLADFEVDGTLADPYLQLLKDASPAALWVASNDNWTDNPNAADIVTIGAAVGAFDLAADSKDAAILTWLEPGTYTAKVSGVGEITGVALVEVYEVKLGAGEIVE